MKETKRNEIWFNTKQKNEEKRYREIAKKVILKNAISAIKNDKLQKSFNRFFLSSSILNIKILFKKEMIANSKDFVYEDPI